MSDRTSTTLHALLLAGVTLVASGCGGEGRCQPWEELPVSVVDAEDPEAAVATFRERLEGFRAWRLTEATCVTSATLGEADADGALGRYSTVRRAVSFEPAEPALWLIAHEFCHGVDHELDWTSEEHAALLQPYADQLIDNPAYPTNKLRLRDGFARLCSAGPALPALLNTLEQVCGTNGADEAMGWVAETAYPHYVEEVGLSQLLQTFSIARQSSAISGSGQAGLPVQTLSAWGDAGLLLLDLAFDEEAPEAQAISSELLRVDAEGVIERLPLPAYGASRINGNVNYAQHTLLGSTGAPLLYAVVGEEVGQAWRVEADPLRLEPVGALGLPVEDSWVHGFERDGVLLGWTGAEAPAFRYDLRSGEATTLGAGDEHYVDSSQTLAFSADADGALAVHPAGTALTLVSYDWDGALTSAVDLPLTGGRVRSVNRLPDGRVMITPVVSLPERESVAVTLRYDPSTGAWSTPGERCDALADSSWFPWGEGVARVDAAASGEGYGLELFEASVGE